MIPLCMLHWIAFLLALTPDAAADATAAFARPLPSYVGRAVCLECHAPDHRAEPCSLEPIPRHLQSYQALAKPEAHHIAAISGLIDPPADSVVCMECHTTGSDVGPRWREPTFDIEQGIQCESCHQAGSLHVAARREGESDPTAGTDHGVRASTRRSCGICHVEKPTHHEVLDLGYRIPETDRLYKTPVNLACSPDGRLLYVVCEHGNSLVVVDPAAGKVTDEITIDGRPQDVAVSPDGTRLYVTRRFDALLAVIDAATRQVITEITVGPEPHGVLTDRSGDRIFVLNTSGNSISVLDARNLTEIRRLSAGNGPWSLALDPDGSSLYITSVRPRSARFRDPPWSEVTVLDAETGYVRRRLVAHEANMLQGVATVPHRGTALFTLMRTKNLVPLTRLTQGWCITNGLGIVSPDGRVDQVLLDEPNAHFPDPTDIAVSPDGRVAIVLSGGSDMAAVIDIDALLSVVAGATDDERTHVLPNHLGMSGRFVRKRFAVGSNPRAVIFSPDGRFAYIANALDDSVSVIDTDTFSVIRTIPLGGPTQITEIRRGERLFHGTDLTFGRQFSCRSCHPDGHINGLTFDIEADGIGMHPVDNRTLRGIFDTPPFKWEGTNPSLQRQCGARLAVFFTRLAPFAPDELDALVSYMRTIERPRNPLRVPTGLTLAQRRGKAIFERTTMNNGTPLQLRQRCIHCHAGGHRTVRRLVETGTTLWFDAPVDADPSGLFDEREYGALGIFYFADAGIEQKQFDIPHLVNIYASPPYLHNGAAHTLEEIWTRFNMVNGHGMTADLTRRQLNDLIAYLKVL